MDFIIAKFRYTIFTHLKSPVNFKYAINGTTLQSLDNYVADPGFFSMSYMLSPNIHIERACYKSLKNLGFIKRITTEFKLESPLKELYCSLVRAILEYGSIIWNLNTAHNNAIALERVEITFLKYASHYNMLYYCL